MKALSLSVSRIAAWAAVCLALPAAAEWSYDPSAQTLTQGSVVLANVTANGAKLTIGNNKSNATAVALDFSTGVAGGYEIASIAASAFDGNKNVTSLVLPDTLTSVGQSAFISCSNIGGTLVLPDSLTSVGNHPFYGLGIRELRMGSGLSRVNNWMFYNCSKLTNVVWNAAVRGVNERGFFGCKTLKTFTGPGTDGGFPTNLTSVGWGAFYTDGYESSLTGLDLRLPALTSMNAQAFRTAGIRSVDIGGGVTSIGTDTFRVCLKLESAVFNEGTKNVGDGCFGWCTSITNVVFPDTLVTLGNGARRRSSRSAPSSAPTGAPVRCTSGGAAFPIPSSSISRPPPATTGACSAGRRRPSTTSAGRTGRHGRPSPRRSPRTTRPTTRFRSRPKRKRSASAHGARPATSRSCGSTFRPPSSSSSARGNEWAARRQAAHLLGLRTPEQVSRDPLRGHLFENLVVSDFVKEAFNRDDADGLFFFRTSDGLEIDLVRDRPGGLQPIEIKSSQTWSDSLAEGLTSFRKLVPDCIDPVLVYAGRTLPGASPARVVNFLDAAADVR